MSDEPNKSLPPVWHYLSIIAVDTNGPLIISSYEDIDAQLKRIFPTDTWFSVPAATFFRTFSNRRPAFGEDWSLYFRGFDYLMFYRVLAGPSTAHDHAALALYLWKGWQLYKSILSYSGLDPTSPNDRTDLGKRTQVFAEAEDASGVVPPYLEPTTRKHAKVKPRGDQ